jgi:N6-adenosine-specific RNA methylase IME4
VIDLEQVAAGEYAENAFRKDFTPSEMVDLLRALEPVERERARGRQLAGVAPSGNFPKGPGRALDKIARVVGRDRKTITKAAAVVDAAEAEPEKFGRLKEDMDRTGRVDGPYRRLKVVRQAAAIRAEPPPLPGNGPYRVIVADAPWLYEIRKDDPSHRAAHPFPQMSIEQICAVPVGSIAAPDCILWLWTTNHHMRQAYAVLDAWGFTEKTIVTWGKDKMGYGDWLRGQTEHCIMAVRGRPIVELTNQTTLLHGKVRENSRKPAEFYDFVEKLCPAPRYAELFSRYRHNDKWDCHGDEVGKFCPERQPNAPDPRVPPAAKPLADLIEQLPRVAAEVAAADGLDIPPFLKREKARSAS